MGYYGRRDIYVEDVTDENIKEILNRVIALHSQNRQEENYLYEYRKGNQPILSRTKQRNSHILNKVVENHAAEFVDFKNGYFLTQPAFYVARDEKKASKVEKLNNFLYLSGKQRADNEIVNWFHTVGKGVLYVASSKDEDCPIECYALDPRDAFVCYSLDPKKEPVLGVHFVQQDDYLIADAYTKDKKYTFKGVTKSLPTTDSSRTTYVFSELEQPKRNSFGEIPIIEYKANDVNMACFEAAIPLLDAINTCQSNRLDGVEQFIQSVMVATNVEFEEDTTAEQIKTAGMICLKSTSDNKADIKILSEQLDQQQTQTLIDDMYKQALTISAMPDITGNAGSSSDTMGAVLYRQGWANADAAARNTEDLFKSSNAYFDKIFMNVLKKTKKLDIKRGDYELQFVRNETANIQAKAQALYTMLSAGMSPILAFQKSGISNDPVADVEQSEKYLNARWKVDEPENAGEQANDNQDPMQKLDATSDTNVVDEKVDMRLEENQTDKEKAQANK